MPLYFYIMKSNRLIATVTNDLNQDQRMQRICATLSGIGFDTLLVGRQRSNSQPIRHQPFRQLRLKCIFNRGKLFYAEYAIRIFLFLLANPWEVVYAVDLDTLPSAVLAARFKGRTCVYDAHEWFSETPEVERRPFIRWFWRMVGRLTVPKADLAITVGPALAKQLSTEYGRPFEVVRNVPAERSPLPQLKTTRLSNPVLLYQGALNEGRALEAIIETLPLFPEAELWLAGQGDKEELLKNMVQRLGLGDRVRFLGMLDPENLYETTRQATIGLNLLEQRSKSYYFSLANKAFDYIQAGVPAIHMDFPEYRSLNSPYPVAELIEELTPLTIASAIRKITSQASHYEVLRQNCLQSATFLTWTSESKVLEKIMNKYLISSM